MKKFLSLIAILSISAISMASTATLGSKEVQSNMQMPCFDFYDSCGGAWEVCHDGVSTTVLIDFLWNWDGGC